MKFWQKTFLTTVILAAVAITPDLQAQNFMRAMRRLKFWTKASRVDTLIVSGNYARSRLLAEMAQYKTGQPIVLISPLPGGGTEIFVMPKQPVAERLEKKDFAEFVDITNPKRVVILGDSSYVPVEYVDMINRRHQVMVLASNDWVRNAEALANVCGGWRLLRDYRAQLALLESPEANRPPADSIQPVVAQPLVPAANAAPAPVADPAPFSVPAPAATETRSVEPLLPPIILPPVN